jgi:poly(3-hydroxybutyrate) depolymerase
MRLRRLMMLLHDARPCAALIAFHSLESKGHGELTEQLPSAWKQCIRHQLFISYRAFKPGTQMHLYKKCCALHLRTAGKSCRIRLGSLLVLILLAALVLMPACGSGNNSSGGGTCTAVPSAPTGLATSNTTGLGTTLNWTAPNGLAANCSATGYTIYENGTSIGTSTTTSFNVTGLTPMTMYSFTVAASDAAGLGAQSSAASVTTGGPAGTNTNLASSENPMNVGQSVTFTASVTPQFGSTVTGEVVFYNGTTELGEVPLSGGVASLTTTTLASGTNSITATYTGSTDYTSSTSNVLSEVVDEGTTIPATMVWDGVTRYYQVFLPAVLPANPPLLLMLHGTHFEVPPANPSTATWGWQSVANQYEFIEVQPASTYNASSGQWNWNAYFMDAAFTSSEAGTCTSPPATSCPDDAGFLRQLILNLTTQYNLNPDMIFVTGMSSGAQMAERVGVEISDLVAAIAPTSGQMEGQQSVPPPVMVPGSALAPISVQEWHGTADTELPPCNYGPTGYSGVTYYLDTVDDTFNYWVSQNQCSKLQTKQTLCTDGSATSGLAGNIATGCTGDNIEVQFIWEQGVAHTWEESDNNSRWLFLSSHQKQNSDATRER